MRFAALVAIVMVLVASVVLSLRGGDRDASTPPGHATPDLEREPEREPAPADPQRSEVPATTPDRAAPAPPTDPPATAPQHRADDAAPPLGVVALEVVDRASGEPVRAFRYLLSGDGTARHDRAIDGANADIELAAGARRTLRVEADGYAPSEPIALELAPGETRLPLRVPLERAGIATGVRFVLRRADTLEPVPRVEVRANLREHGAAGATFRELWHRRSENPRGEFELPELPPGRYAFDLQALDADGRAAALLPVTHELDWFGAEAFEVPLDLQPGVRLALTVVDAANGEAIGERFGAWLTDAADRPVPLRWLHRDGGRVLAGADALPASARCEVESPLPPGRYTLHVAHRDDVTPQTLSLQLVVGVDAELRVPIAR